MKEKRVDVYLAKAGFFQVMFYGFGGAFLAGLMDYRNAEFKNLLGSGLATLACAVVVYHYYAKATRLSKKIKHKTYAG
jgi:hypothetical protein